MQIKIIFDDKEVGAMVNKMNRQPYNKLKIYEAGQKIMKAYDVFNKSQQPQKSEGQTDIYDMLKMFGGKIID